MPDFWEINIDPYYDGVVMHAGAYVMKWFDRKFALGLPLWMFPNIVERLRGTPARVEELIGDLPNDTLTRRAQEAWSIQENVGHLLDVESLWLARAVEFVEGVEVLRPADLTNRKTHEAHHNEQAITALLDAFRMERRKLVEMLEQVDESFHEASALHPRLNQSMRAIDLAFFTAEHDDHHLARITELVRLHDGQQERNLL